MRGFGEIAERLRRSTVQVFSNGRQTGGSGIVWDASGMILTNAHVARSSRLEVQLWDGRKIEGQVASLDSRRDLALVRIAASGLEPAGCADSSTLRPGELVIAIGSPLGFAGALSTGVVHSIGPLPGMGSQNWIRADVRLAPGNSGGPLANAEGHVVGINTAIVHGLGVAVPSNAAAEFLRQGPRPRLGIVMRPVTYGLQVLEVQPGTPAAAAALKPGDVLIGSPDTLYEALDSGQSPLRLRFFRGDYTRVRETWVRLPAQAEAA